MRTLAHSVPFAGDVTKAEALPALKYVAKPSAQASPQRPDLTAFATSESFSACVAVVHALPGEVPRCCVGARDVRPRDYLDVQRYELTSRSRPPPGALRLGIPAPKPSVTLVGQRKPDGVAPSTDPSPGGQSGTPADSNGGPRPSTREVGSGPSPLGKSGMRAGVEGGTRGRTRKGG
jgi:hypothetical protein